MKVSCDVKEISVTQTALGRALGVSGARVNQMVKEGIAVLSPEDDKGSVLLFESLKNYFTVGGGVAPTGEEIDYNKEHARLEKLKADKEEIRVGMLKGELYEAKIVEQTMADIYATLRTQLLGIPTKIASQLPEETRDKVYDIIYNEIEGKLLEMSQYSPDMFISEMADGE